MSAVSQMLLEMPHLPPLSNDTIDYVWWKSYLFFLLTDSWSSSLQRSHWSEAVGRPGSYTAGNGSAV